MPEVLSNLSDDMAAAVAAASPSVVRVAARDRLPGSGIVWSTDGVKSGTPKGLLFEESDPLL